MSRVLACCLIAAAALLGSCGAKPKDQEGPAGKWVFDKDREAVHIVESLKEAQGAKFTPEARKLAEGTAKAVSEGTSATLDLDPNGTFTMSVTYTTIPGASATPKKAAGTWARDGRKVTFVTKEEDGLKLPNPRTEYAEYAPASLRLELNAANAISFPIFLKRG